MKKLLLSLGLVLVGSHAMSQVIFAVESPAPIAGFYDFTAAGAGWGLPSLNGVLVIDTVQLANDGTPGVNAQGNPASATGCNTFTLPAQSLAGKVAMVFRGDGGNPGVGACEFGTKALKCQQAGAIAVIIVNRDATTLAMSPGSGTPTDGSQVTIPVVMVNLATGQAIMNQLQSGPVVVLIGDKTGHYDDDITTFDNNSVRANFGAKPSALAQNASEFSLSPGTWVYNNGVNDQTGVTLNTVIKRNGTEVYNQTSSPFNILSGDSLFMTTPTFSSASYQVGQYEVAYNIAMTATDEFTGDNLSTTYFDISDSLWSLSRLDATAGKVVHSDGFYRAAEANLPVNTFEACMVLKDPNASRVALDGVYFGGFAVGAADTLSINLDGFEVLWTLYTWNDATKTVTGGTFTQINSVAEGGFTYPEPADPLEEKTIFMPITSAPSYRFVNNQDYLLCVTSLQPKLYMAYNTTDYYDLLLTPAPGTPAGTGDGLIRFPFRSETTTWTNGGFGITPSIAIRTGATLNVSENELVKASAFPVPAKDVITVKVNAAGDATLKIVDMAGREVSNQQVKIENGQFTTSVAGINGGTYVFTLDYANGTTSRFNVVVSK